MRFPIRCLAVLLILLAAGFFTGPNTTGPIAWGEEQPAEPPAKKQTKQEKKDAKEKEKAAKEAEKAKKLQAELLAKQQEAKQLAAIEQQAKQQQQEWAKKLKIPVETKNKSGIALVLIPPADKEVPEPYYIGKYEITQAEWKLVQRNPDGADLSSPSKFNSDNEAVKGLDTVRFPVEMVGWIQCVQFCNILSEIEGLQPYYGLMIQQPDGKTAIGKLQDGIWHRGSEIKILGGNGYHLPTNAQWEHACRAGTITPYYFGSSAENLGEYAWYRANSSNRPHPVGEKKPNAFGLFDMAGNVCEWSEEIKINTAEADGRSVSKTDSIARGGAHQSPLIACESAATWTLAESSTSWNIGMRVVRAATPPKDLPPAALDERLYYKIQFVAGQKVLGISGAKDDNGRVILTPSNDNQGQQWKFVKAGDFYKIVNRKSGKALNVANGSNEENAEIIQWDAADDGENQQWSLVPQGEHFVLKARHSGLVLDVERDAKKGKATVVQATLREGRSQSTELVPVKE